MFDVKSFNLKFNEFLANIPFRKELDHLEIETIKQYYLFYWKTLMDWNNTYDKSLKDADNDYRQEIDRVNAALNRAQITIEKCCLAIAKNHGYIFEEEKESRISGR